MNKTTLFFRIALIASGFTALIIRLISDFMITAYLRDFEFFQLFVAVSFPIYGFFAAASLIFGIFTLKKDKGSAVAAQIFYLACLYVALSVFLSISGYQNAVSADLTLTNIGFIPVDFPFLYNYGKGVGDIAQGDLSNYMFALAITLSLILGLIALVQLIKSIIQNKLTPYANPKYARSSISVPSGYHSHYTNETKTQKPYTNAKDQKDIFDTSNDFFSHHTEDDIF